MPKKKVTKKTTKKVELDTKQYFKEVKKVGDRIQITSHNGRVMDFKDLDSAIIWAQSHL